MLSQSYDQHLDCGICSLNGFAFLLYIILYYTILYYTILYYTILFYSLALSRVQPVFVYFRGWILSFSIHYNIIPSILYYTIPYLYHTIPYHTISYYTIPYHTILYCTIP